MSDFNPWIKYERWEDFFNLNGNAIMRLTPVAAINLCKELSKKNMRVIRIEGGLHSSDGFEARRDCIWDATGNETVIATNDEAVEFIERMKSKHNAFVVTT